MNSQPSRVVEGSSGSQLEKWQCNIGYGLIWVYIFFCFTSDTPIQISQQFKAEVSFIP